MTYLTGKRFETDPELIDGATEAKSGVIVSEPFNKPCAFASDGQTPIDWETRVAVMWEDGSMEDAIDVELLKVLPEEPEREPDGYVVAVTWPSDEDGELILETYTTNSSLEEARKVAAKFFNKNPRIAKFYFMEKE